MGNLPFQSSASNENSKPNQGLASDSSATAPPWELAKATEQAPHMFRLHRANGNVISYSYCDLRETRLLSAGYLQVFIFGMEKYLITIEGRHLGDFAVLLGMCRVKSFEELGQRTHELPESCPSIDQVTIEELTGP